MTLRPLVVYFSYTGSTATIASHVIDSIGAVERRLIDEESRDGIRVSLESLLRMKAKLRDPDFHVAEHDPIVLLTPVWSGEPTPAMNAFLVGTNLRGKKVIAGLVGGKRENPRALAKIREVAIEHQAKYIETVSLRGIPLERNLPKPTEGELRTEGGKVARLVAGILDV